MRNMTKEEFVNHLKILGIEFTDEKLYKLDKYFKMLIQYNKMFNLTAITKEEDIYLKHFYDSLTIIKVVDLNKELKVLDIGTGAGFPGIVLKIFFPKLEITLLDSNNKKIGFLNEVIKELKLENINCICGRAETLEESFRDYFDIVVSRAVATLRILLELSIPYVKVDGLFIALKGKAEEEVEDAESTIKVLKCKMVGSEKLTLPDNLSERTILKFRKESVTPREYPRKYDKIKKRKIK